MRCGATMTPLELRSKAAWIRNRVRAELPPYYIDGVWNPKYGGGPASALADAVELERLAAES